MANYAEGKKGSLSMWSFNRKTHTDKHNDTRQINKQKCKTAAAATTTTATTKNYPSLEH